MSFSFQAGGTREETLQSLGTELSSPDGERTRQLVLSFLQNTADAGHDGTPLRYDVSAYGHHDDSGGSLPSLSVTLTCAWKAPAATD